MREAQNEYDWDLNFGEIAKIWRGGCIIRAERLPQNLLQAQRDYFGAHTYERVDAARGKFFHLDWPHPERPQSEES